MVELTDSEFQYIYSFVKKNYGINLINKRKLIEARLFSTLYEKGLTSFSDYIKLITVKDSPEVLKMMTKLTTNHTFFMRENLHFEYLTSTVLPELTKNNPMKTINLWSAGCSTGQEIYNINMILRDYFGLSASQWKLSSLATDISQKVLAKAKSGIYTKENMDCIPDNWKRLYFNYNKADETYQIKPLIADTVKFEYLNLMDDFCLNSKFDFIFCRNVMIYFDSETKAQLAQKFYNALKPGGYLFIGLSETLQYEHTKLKYIKPSIYRKVVS